MTGEVPGRVRVWDAPTRLSHWGMAACFGMSWWTAETHRMDWHRYSGYVLLGLLLFRLFWGFFGSSTARFSAFVRGPGAIREHLVHLRARIPTPGLGHNALGALSVLAMLLMLLAQVTLGLFAVDVDGIESGPLSHLVEFDTGRTLAKYHELGFTVLQWLIGLHLVAVLFYTFYKREPLIAAMISGSRPRQADWSPAPGSSRFAPAWLFLLGAALAALATWYITSS